MTDAESIELECECGRAACPETAKLSRLAYERIRSSREGFIVVLGHVRLGTERVIEAGDRYAVVQGKAGLVAHRPSRQTAMGAPAGALHRNS